MNRPPKISGPKLAHLFLVREDLNHEGLWREFFHGQSARYTMYVHAKSPSRIRSAWLAEKLIPHYCDTEWGRASIVEAELLLLRAALRDRQNQFFLLHSESCVPLRTFEFTYGEIVRHDQTWLYYHDGSLQRYGGVDQSAVRKEHFRKSSQFFCLARKHAELILARLNLNHWRQSWCADEHCIATTLAQQAKLGECLRRDLTFAHWPTPRPSPVTFHSLSADDLELLQTRSALFARKFAVDSDIADYLPFPDRNFPPARQNDRSRASKNERSQPRSGRTTSRQSPLARRKPAARNPVSVGPV